MSINKLKDGRKFTYALFNPRRDDGREFLMFESQFRNGRLHQTLTLSNVETNSVTTMSFRDGFFPEQLREIADLIEWDMAENE